ncbi:uncharacterized protein [Panulirus ornatus]|uniref:uncharacterized protein isoform X2 n=1 Tax=Panulirus ornatus TaxID=150431 RepID=UPI003A83AAE0
MWFPRHVWVAGAALLAMLVTPQVAQESQTPAATTTSRPWNPINTGFASTMFTNTNQSTDIPSNLFNSDTTSNTSRSTTTSLATTISLFTTTSLASITTRFDTTATTTSRWCQGSLTMQPAGSISWEVGTVNIITCSVWDHASPLTASDLVVLRGSTFIPSQVTDNYTIKVTVNASQPDEYYVICTETTHQSSCLGKVTVGYPPLDVEDFQCVSYNWYYLRCRWTIPDNPTQATSDNYKSYLISHTINNECNCQSMDGGGPCDCPKTCCTWQPPEYATVDRDAFVLLKTENALGNRSFVHNISNFAVVLPDEAQEVCVEPEEGSRVLRVTWVLPSPMEVFAGLACIVYRVDHRLKPNAQRNSTWIGREAQRCCSESCKIGEAQVEVQYWWQEYEVRVRLRSGAAPYTLEDDGWWSTWSSRSTTTPQAAPETAPTVGPGTYQVTGDYRGLRDLTVAWRPVPPLLHNGPDFSYLVRATSDDHRGEAVEPVLVGDTFAVFHNLSSDASYRVVVTAANSEGRSSVTSVVMVGAARTMPDAPTLPVVVLHPHSLYELRWSCEDTGVSSYTVYVCTDGLDTKQPCTTNLYWTSVGNVSAVNMTLGDFEVPGEGNPGVRFAVSAESGSGASSGMRWDPCVTPRPYHTTRNPPSLSEPADLQETTALVLWTLECEDWAGVVEAVEARYCVGLHNLTSQCPGENQTSKTLMGAVELKGLQEATQYTVWLRLKYRSGFSQWSNGQTFITLDHRGLPAWTIGVITVVAFVSAVVIVLFLSYSRRRLAFSIMEVKRELNLPVGLLSTDSRPPSVTRNVGLDLPPDSTNPAHTKDHDLAKDSTVKHSVRTFRSGTEVPGGRGLARRGRSLHPGEREEEENNCINLATEWVNCGFVSPDTGEDSSCSPETTSSATVQRRDSAPNYGGYIVHVFPDKHDSETVRKEATPEPGASDSPSSYISAFPRYVATQPHRFTSQGSKGYVPFDMTVRVNPREAIQDDEMTKAEDSSFGKVIPGSGYVAVQPPDFGSRKIKDYVLPSENSHDASRTDQTLEAAPLPEISQPVRLTASIGNSGRYVALEFPESDGEVFGSNSPPQNMDTSPEPSLLSAKLHVGVNLLKGNHLYIPHTVADMTTDVHRHSSLSIVNAGVEGNGEAPSELSTYGPSQGYVAIHPPDFGTFNACVHEAAGQTGKETSMKEIVEDKDAKFANSVSKTFILGDAAPLDPESSDCVLSPLPPTVAQAVEIPALAETFIPQLTEGAPGAEYCSVSHPVPSQTAGRETNWNDGSLNSACLQPVASFSKGTVSQLATDYIFLEQLVHNSCVRAPRPHDDKEVESVSLEDGDESQGVREEPSRRESLTSEDLPVGYSRVGEASITSSML